MPSGQREELLMLTLALKIVEVVVVVVVMEVVVVVVLFIVSALPLVTSRSVIVWLTFDVLADKICVVTASVKIVVVIAVVVVGAHSQMKFCFRSSSVSVFLRTTVDWPFEPHAWYSPGSLLRGLNLTTNLLFFRFCGSRKRV